MFIHISRKVVAMEDFDDYAIVTTTDRSKIKCQLVANADGVRNSMRRDVQNHLALAEEHVYLEYTLFLQISVFGLTSLRCIHQVHLREWYIQSIATAASC